MALPKGVKSPVDYRDLYLSNELEGEVIDEKIGEYIKSAGKFLKDKALPALSKTPMGAKFAIPVVGSLLAGRGLINARKSAIDKNVDKYVRDRRIKGGPKKIDPSSFNAPHHVDDMKTERPKREPMKPKTREELGLRGVNAKVRPVKDGKKVDINKTYIKNLDYKTQMYKEATMTPAQKRKDTMLKKKYEKSDDMMKSFKDQYGKEKGENVFYAFIRKKSMEEENIHEILDKKDVPHIKKLIKKLKDGSELHAKQSKDLEVALKTENTAIESELVIQDWNSDDIKFTEIETVDIIKAKPLKENANLEEGVKRKIIKKLINKAIKKFNTKKAKEATKYSVDNALSKKVQLQSIKNQANYPSQLGRQINKGSTPVKVDVSKPINFDKYFGGSPSPVKKKFGTQKPTGTFTDDLPPVETVPLTKAQKKLMKKLDKQKLKDIENDPMSKAIQKQIENETGTKTRKFSQEGGVTKGNENEILSNLKPKPKKPLKDHFDWREELGEDWQKVNRKDKTDGMSQKAVNAYRKENPGSKLKTAVTKDPKKLKKGSKSAKRRLAFCRRMKGMKKKLTSAKTRRDPDSRINKALRRWNC